VPRFLQILVLLLIFGISGGPGVIAELAGDDCTETCADEEPGSSEDGCGDCRLICSSCPRSHVIVPSLTNHVIPVPVNVARIAAIGAERVPIGPPPQGVFHPPRLAG
jgi:hypothetical protein